MTQILRGLSLMKNPVQRHRIFIILILSLASLGANLFGMIAGITIVLSHLLYFPVILASYWFPRRGIAFSVIITALYGILIAFFGPEEQLLDILSLSRIAMLIIIGTVVALLAKNLAQSEQQLHDIIEFLPDATFAVDKQGKIIAWNRAVEEMTGKMKSAMLGRDQTDVARIFCGEDRPMLSDLVIRCEKISPDRYPEIRQESGKLVAERYLPNFSAGRGVHLRMSATALVDAGGNVTGAIESIRDVTDQVMMQEALENANHRLNTLSGILRHDLSRRLAVLYGHLRLGVMKFNDPEVITFLAGIKEAANGIMRQIEISREYRDIGATQPTWIPVQGAFQSAVGRIEIGQVIFHAWTERLEVFSDPHLSTVFYHILHNAVKTETGATRIIATYRVTHEGCAIIIEDNGKGIAEPQKASLFVQREDSYGRGLFLANEILSITGMTIRETGIPGQGARFEIHIPSEGYRVEGMY